MAPFKGAQRFGDIALMVLFAVLFFFDSDFARSWRLVLAGYLMCLVINCIASLGDQQLAEKFGYKCRDCGQNYSPNGMQPVQPEPINKAVSGS